MKILSGRDEIRRKIRELEYYIPRNPKEHYIREEKINALKIRLDKIESSSLL
jgi:hypothetical protein